MRINNKVSLLEQIARNITLEELMGTKQRVIVLRENDFLRLIHEFYITHGACVYVANEIVYLGWTIKKEVTEKKEDQVFVDECNSVDWKSWE